MPKNLARITVLLIVAVFSTIMVNSTVFAQEEPTLDISVEEGAWNQRIVSATMSGVKEHNHLMDWGDGTNPWGFGGTSGTVSQSHYYATGVFTGTVTVQIEGGVLQQNFVVEIIDPNASTPTPTPETPTPETPTLDVTVTQGSESINQQIVSIMRTNVKEHGHTIDWGDGTELYGFGGKSGTTMESHNYDPGTYTGIVTVQVEGGILQEQFKVCVGNDQAVCIQNPLYLPIIIK